MFALIKYTLCLFCNLSWLQNNMYKELSCLTRAEIMHIVQFIVNDLKCNFACENLLYHFDDVKFSPVNIVLQYIQEHQLTVLSGGVEKTLSKHLSCIKRQLQSETSLEKSYDQSVVRLKKQN